MSIWTKWRRDPTPPTAFDPHASEADISACFRLLLGRAPNPEEWRGHAARAGEDLAGVVRSYVNSLEFANRGLLGAGPMDGVALATFEGVQLYAAANDAAVGAHVHAGRYEPEIVALFRQLLRPGMGVIDLGANIGVFSLLSASLVGPEGWVLAIEPNPANAKLLEASRRANDFAQVTLCQVAAGPTPGLLVLHASYSNGTTSDLPADTASLLAAETVPCLRPDSLVPSGRRIDLIKVDVEGAEYNALSGCTEVIARDRPHLISEFSPNLMPGISGVSGPEYLQWLITQDYGLHVIQPAGGLGPPATVDSIMAEHAARGTDHVDLLAVPTGSG